MLKTTVKNHEETERRYIQCGPFYKQRKSPKHSPLKTLQSALVTWFKQACGNNASTDGTHLKEKNLYIAAHLGIANVFAFNGWTERFMRHNIVYRTLSGESRSVEPETVENWNSYEL
jgi:hypothetical protein